MGGPILQWMSPPPLCFLRFPAAIGGEILNIGPSHAGLPPQSVSPFLWCLPGRLELRRWLNPSCFLGQPGAALLPAWMGPKDSLEGEEGPHGAGGGRWQGWNQKKRGPGAALSCPRAGPADAPMPKDAQPRGAPQLPWAAHSPPAQWGWEGGGQGVMPAKFQGGGVGGRGGAEQPKQTPSVELWLRVAGPGCPWLGQLKGAKGSCSQGWPRLAKAAQGCPTDPGWPGRAWEGKP